MSFEITMAVETEYLRMTATGKFSIPDLFEFIERVMTEAIAARRDKVLVDSRGVIGAISDTERFMGGLQSAKVFGSRLKVAVLMPAETITKMAELAATNRGTKLLISGSEDEAITWLASN